MGSQRESTAEQRLVWVEPQKQERRGEGGEGRRVSQDPPSLMDLLATCPLDFLNFYLQARQHFHPSVTSQWPLNEVAWIPGHPTWKKIILIDHFCNLHSFIPSFLVNTYMQDTWFHDLPKCGQKICAESGFYLLHLGNAGKFMNKAPAQLDTVTWPERKKITVLIIIITKKRRER